jgi:hypothetical protein
MSVLRQVMRVMQMVWHMTEVLDPCAHKTAQVVVPLVLALGCCVAAGAACSRQIWLRGGRQTSWLRCCSGSGQMTNW